MGMNLLFLTTTGRKSGQRRQTPVAWFPDGDDALLIVASAGGSVRSPDWPPDPRWAGGLRGRRI